MEYFNLAQGWRQDLPNGRVRFLNTVKGYLSEQYNTILRYKVPESIRFSPDGATAPLCVTHDLACFGRKEFLIQSIIFFRLNNPQKLRGGGV